MSDGSKTHTSYFSTIHQIPYAGAVLSVPAAGWLYDKRRRIGGQPQFGIGEPQLQRGAVVDTAGRDGLVCRAHAASAAREQAEEERTTESAFDSIRRDAG